MNPKTSRAFGWPSGETFSIPAIADFIDRHTYSLPPNPTIIDPFARNSLRGTTTNDLNPDTKALYHLEAEDFCNLLAFTLTTANMVLFDPPYSPRQISELYKSIGLKVGIKETQNASLYKRVRDAFDPLVKPGGLVLSFGWNSSGMGQRRGYEIEEILLVYHGGAHNDTICLAERKTPQTGTC